MGSPLTGLPTSCRGEALNDGTGPLMGKPPFFGRTLWSLVFLLPARRTRAASQVRENPRECDYPLRILRGGVGALELQGIRRQVVVLLLTAGVLYVGLPVSGAQADVGVIWVVFEKQVSPP